MLLDVKLLERRKMGFDEAFAAGRIQFEGSDWSQRGELLAAGQAELLDSAGSRTIRVRGHIHALMDGTCARCLDPVSKELDDYFELFYYPLHYLSYREKEDIPIDTAQADIGFYEDPGIELADVLKEQIVLWLPMRGLCHEDCKGMCPRCGMNLNRGKCSCVETFVDPRWDALRKLHLKR